METKFENSVRILRTTKLQRLRRKYFLSVTLKGGGVIASSVFHLCNVSEWFIYSRTRHYEPFDRTMVPTLFLRFVPTRKPYFLHVPQYKRNSVENNRTTPVSTWILYVSIGAETSFVVREYKNMARACTERRWQRDGSIETCCRRRRRSSDHGWRSCGWSGGGGGPTTRSTCLRSIRAADSSERSGAEHHRHRNSVLLRGRRLAHDDKDRENHQRRPSREVPLDYKESDYRHLWRHNRDRLFTTHVGHGGLFRFNDLPHFPDIDLNNDK